MLIGGILRLETLNHAGRFHPDEALFATFARNAAIYGDWWLTGALDKPPLTLYLMALSMHLTAAHITPQNVIDIDPLAGEIAARLPNVLMGILLIPLTAALAAQLFPHQPRHLGRYAALIVAASPYGLVFSAAAFTDMTMLTLMTAALYAAAGRRSGWSGALLALSMAAKTQGIYFLPLIALILWHIEAPRRAYLHFTITFAAGLGLLWGWDALRPGMSLFILASANNRPADLWIAPADWPIRATTWANYSAWLLSAPALTAGLIGCGLWGLWHRRDRLTLILWLYSAGYYALHVMIGFNQYDRYLLPLLPLLAVAAAYGLAQIRLPRWSIIGLAALCLATAAPVSHWRIDLGRDHYPLDHHADILRLADFLNAQPLGTIIYDRWLGWEMSYYLGAWSDKRRVYYPEPAIFASDALRNPDRAPRYFIHPDHLDVTDWLHSLHQHGFTIQPSATFGRFAVWKLSPPTQPVFWGGAQLHKFNFRGLKPSAIKVKLHIKRLKQAIYCHAFYSRLLKKHDHLGYNRFSTRRLTLIAEGFSPRKGSAPLNY